MNSPIVVIDARSPQKALENLSKHFTVVPFFSENITYDAIAGHPDIFICQGKTPIFAPNTPHNIIASIKNNTNETIIYGNNNIGKDLENSTFYNCVVTDSYIFHKKKFTDPVIIEKNTDKHFINVPQAYTRCSLIEIKNNVFITSDKGIYQELTKNNCECLYVNPQGIQLPPYKYGFIGGCMGKCDDTIYINGSLSKHSNGSTIKKFISKYNLDIIELHDGELYDGGGIFFFSA